MIDQSKLAQFKGFDFTKLREEKGLSLEELAEKINVTVDKLSQFEEGWNNPMKGALLNGISEVLEIDHTQLKAFIMWRRDKWADWEARGCPDPDPQAWNDVEDYKGEYLEDLGFFEVEEEEELPEAEEEQLKDSLEANADATKNPFEK